jgi:hypothetical protein
LRRDGVTFAPDDVLVECLGAGTCFDGMPGVAREVPEVVLRIAVRSDDKRAVERFGQELAPMLLAGPPGATGFAGGRPKASELLAHWPTLVSRAAVTPTVTVEEVR